MSSMARTCGGLAQYGCLQLLGHLQWRLAGVVLLAADPVHLGEQHLHKWCLLLGVFVHITSSMSMPQAANGCILSYDGSAYHALEYVLAQDIFATELEQLVFGFWKQQRADQLQAARWKINVQHRVLRVQFRQRALPTARQWKCRPEL